MIEEKNWLGEVFEHLRKGGFISENTNHSEQKRLYDFLNKDKNFRVAKSHFEALYLQLEKGDGYFYFSKSHHTLINVDTKIQAVYKWIDILDFFKTYNPAFGQGMIYSPYKIEIECEENIPLKQKLERMKIKNISANSSILEKIQFLTKELIKHDFVIKQPNQERYKVLSAINYLERLVNLINIEENETTS